MSEPLLEAEHATKAPAPSERNVLRALARAFVAEWSPVDADNSIGVGRESRLQMAESEASIVMYQDSLVHAMFVLAS